MRVDSGRRQNSTLRGMMPIECAIHSWSWDREEFGEIADGILAGGMHAAEFPLLSVGKFGLFAARFPLGVGDGHALAGAHADEIGLELGEGGEGIEEHLSHGIARVVERPAEGQFHASFLELASDGAGIRDGPGEAVEFRHDQRVAIAHGGESLIEAGSGAGCAGESVVGVDAIWGDAEFQEGLALGGQILLVGGTAGVSDECSRDEGCRHGISVRIGSRIRNCYRTIHMRRCWYPLAEVGATGWAVRWTFPLRTVPAMPV